MNDKTCSCCSSTKQNEPEPRRGFLAKLIAIGVGAAAFLTPVAVGLRAFFSPMQQKSGAGEFMKVTTVDALTATPTRISLTKDQVDAWNFVKAAPLGTIFVQKKADGQIVAFQACCPHAGCTIGVTEGKNGEGPLFLCPCHKAWFDLSGVRTQKSSPSPRDMDMLEVEIRNDTEVWVKYQNFQTGTSSQIASA